MGTHPILNVIHVRNSGLPKGREPYGNGAAVVVRAGESPVHGEGRQVDRSLGGEVGEMPRAKPFDWFSTVYNRISL